MSPFNSFLSDASWGQKLSGFNVFPNCFCSFLDPLERGQLHVVIRMHAGAVHTRPIAATSHCVAYIVGHQSKYFAILCLLECSILHSRYDLQYISSLSFCSLPPLPNSLRCIQSVYYSFSMIIFLVTSWGRHSAYSFFFVQIPESIHLLPERGYFREYLLGKWYNGFPCLKTFCWHFQFLITAFLKTLWRWTESARPWCNKHDSKCSYNMSSFRMFIEQPLVTGPCFFTSRSPCSSLKHLIHEQF